MHARSIYIMCFYNKNIIFVTYTKSVFVCMAVILYTDCKLHAVFLQSICIVYSNVMYLIATTSGLKCGSPDLLLYPIL